MPENWYESLDHAEPSWPPRFFVAHDEFNKLCVWEDTMHPTLKYPEWDPYVSYRTTPDYRYRVIVRWGDIDEWAWDRIVAGLEFIIAINPSDPFIRSADTVVDFDADN